MNIRKTSFTRVCLLCVCVLAFQTFDIFAQSGRKPTETQQTPNTTSSSPSKNQSNNVVSEEQEEFKYIPTTGIQSFFKELNEAGKHGYKLEHITPVVADRQYSVEAQIASVKFTGIIGRDSANKYEYNWFLAEEATNFETRLNSWLKLGFAFRESISIIAKPNASDEEKASNPLADEEIVGNIILVERKNEGNPKSEYQIVEAKWTVFSNPTKIIETKVSEAFRKGFRPISIFRSITLVSVIGIATPARSVVVILKKDTEQQSRTTDTVNANDVLTKSNTNSSINSNNLQPEYKLLLRSPLKSLNSKFESAGKDGYRLALVHAEIALMYRDSGKKTPVAYKRVKWFSDELPKLFEQGATYRIVGYSSYLFEKDLLYFEKQSKNSKPRSEYQIVVFTDEFSDIQKENIKRLKNTFIYEDSISAFRRLLKEGYVIRDLIDSNVILVERSQ